MSITALLLAIQAVRPDTVLPVLQIPDSALDDPAAYEGYRTRLYRDARGNTVQIFLDQKTGRVVHLWADALDESIGFTVRDVNGAPAALDWSGQGATNSATRGTRSFGYRLSARGAVRMGLFLLGSLRVERDFHYANRDTLPLEAPTFVPQEFTQLVDKVGRLPTGPRRQALALLGVPDLATLRARLEPGMTVEQTATTWRVRIAQPSLDGKNHLTLTLSGDARAATVSPRAGVVTIRPRGTGPVTITIEITTDGPALTPVSRNALFNDAFRRFSETMRADAAHPLRFRRLEREVRGFELLSSRQKFMAGLPAYATYFGRDMLMTALLMEPVWADTMPEFVIAAALAKLGPAGDVSHEEALGGQAIRENAAEFNRSGELRLLGNLQRVRENYWMVDDDFQLPVVAGHYFADSAVPADRKRRFVARYGALLGKNLAYVWRRAQAYAREPVATNLVDFKRDPDGWWHPGSWRDSRVGYAGGRFAFDVNAVWVPLALEAIAAIRPSLDSTPGLPDSTTLARAIATWRGAARHFEVTFSPAEAMGRVQAKLASLPDAEHAHWDSVLARHGPLTDTLRFYAVSLDSAGRPVPVMSTDPAMLLFLTSLDTPAALRPFLLPYPLGLFVDRLGPLVANDAYASADVWRMYERDLYHSPRVVWGREVNLLLAALARRGAAARPVLDSVLAAVDGSGLRYGELWSYRIDGGGLHPARYGVSSDVQLWSLTDLAVQYLLNLH